MSNAASILSSNGINKTKFRIDLLNLFYNSRRSLSVEFIINVFADSINKVTIYRALENFEARGLIHRVPDQKNYKRYALCRESNCDATSHDHNHGHFICHSCNHTFCIEDVKIPEFTGIKGFYVKESSLTLEGYCSDCYEK